MSNGFVRNYRGCKRTWVSNLAGPFAVLIAPHTMNPVKDGHVGYHLTLYRYIMSLNE